jgi:xylan 1,4-beta-xylosidase
MRTFGKTLAHCSAILLLLSVALAQNATETIMIDALAPSHPFPHFWETMFGSGRAILSLRDSYRRDLRDTRRATGLQYVRFHGILQDEVGLYHEDAQGKPFYNFSYVDQIYDGLLEQGVRPFVELSFMPPQLAAKPIYQSFWYKPIVSPPKDWKKWDDLMAALAEHLVSRYGIEEVSQWYFEVWNEPNLDFWGGDPRQETYWQLYEHTARALKAVSPKIRVGGPATAQAAWADAFIRYCKEHNVPVDFVSSHVYGDDRAQDVFGTQEFIPRDQMVCRAVKKVHDQIKSSAMPGLPLIWSEFNATYQNLPDVTDTIFMGPWMADTIRQCDGLVDIMSYWTFSDVFEEQGVVKQPFYGGYGLIAAGGIPKPAYFAFELLHDLGDTRLSVDSNSALLTRRKDGTLVLAVWNYSPPDQTEATKRFTLRWKNAALKQASIRRVDEDHSNVLAIYEKLGRPVYPTRKQIDAMRDAAKLAAPETKKLDQGFTISIPGHGLVVMELR